LIGGNSGASSPLKGSRQAGISINRACHPSTRGKSASGKPARWANGRTQATRKSAYVTLSPMSQSAALKCLSRIAAEVSNSLNPPSTNSSLTGQGRSAALSPAQNGPDRRLSRNSSTPTQPANHVRQGIAHWPKVRFGELRKTTCDCVRLPGGLVFLHQDRNTLVWIELDELLTLTGRERRGEFKLNG